jgi:hypothetical protein
LLPLRDISSWRGELLVADCIVREREDVPLTASDLVERPPTSVRDLVDVPLTEVRDRTEELTASVRVRDIVE